MLANVRRLEPWTTFHLAYRKYNIKVVVFKVLVMKHAFTWVCIIRNVTGNVVRPVVNFKCLKYYTRL